MHLVAQANGLSFESLFESGEFDIDELDLFVKKGIREGRRLEERHHELRARAVCNDSGGHGPTRLRIVPVVIEDSVAGIRANAELGWTVWCHPYPTMRSRPVRLPISH